ncbi:MAG: tRNA (adenosine(37)-N6)-threonylcarbamoyltransferase complex ATPase subunit type 1 TsaE [Bacteroidales bacterium]
MKQETIHLNSIKDLPALASRIIESTEEISLWGFYGNLGAGKTTLIREICSQLKVLDTVNSPTFALVNEYRLATGGSVYHFDFYRIKDSREAFDIGYEEYFYSGNLCLIEWPDRIEELLPEAVAVVRIIRNEDDSRTVILEIP